MRLEEFMNYIRAGTLLSVHSFDHVDRKLVLIGCTILRGSEASEMLLEFMSCTTRNRRMNGSVEAALAHHLLNTTLEQEKANCGIRKFDSFSRRLYTST